MTTGVHAGEEILLVVLGAVVIAIAATYARRRLIAKGAPLLLVAERAAGTQAWSLRLARYDSDTLDLFSLGGVSLVPKRRIGRGVGGLVSVASVPQEDWPSLVTDPVVVRCRDGADVVDLAISRPQYTAVRAWIESSRPGDIPHEAA